MSTTFMLVSTFIIWMEGIVLSFFNYLYFYFGIVLGILVLLLPERTKDVPKKKHVSKPKERPKMVDGIQESRRSLTVRYKNV